MVKSYFKQPFITFLAHISAWGVFLCVPLLLRQQENIDPSERLKEVPLEGMLLLFFFLILLFYLNYSVLIPKILNKKGIRYYLPSLLGLFFFHWGTTWVIKSLFIKDSILIPKVAFIFPFLLIIAMSISIRLLADKAQADKDMRERENETLKSELSFLRSQISPHFLFNIMNNIIALSRIKPDMVEPTLIKLSHLMRYMLYNSDEKKVSIAKEIDYLENYIDLQKLRFGDSVEVNFVKNTEGGNALNIEPMLLIPFVENAFKHGTGMIQKPIIHIGLSIKKTALTFTIVNKFDLNSQEAKDKDSGIGLKNVSRRLELLYGQNQNLAVNTEGGLFKVDLRLVLN